MVLMLVLVPVRVLPSLTWVNAADRKRHCLRPKFRQRQMAAIAVTPSGSLALQPQSGRSEIPCDDRTAPRGI